MAGQSMTLTAEFPRSFRGYSTIAVDDFVRQLGTRLDSLQQWTETQAAKIDRLTTELGTVDRSLSAFMEKELALANALVMMEQQRLVVDNDLDIARENAQIQINEMLADAQRDAAAIVAEAERQADGIRDDVAVERTAAEERLRMLKAEYDATVSSVRRTLEAELALLCDTGPAMAVTHAAVTVCDTMREELYETAA